MAHEEGEKTVGMNTENMDEEEGLVRLLMKN